MKQRIVKKNRGGFTLAETLIAVLILLMVSGIVAAGIPAAKEALTKAVDASHSQLLLSTTMTALRNELGSARSIICDMELVEVGDDEAGDETGDQPGDETGDDGTGEGETESEIVTAESHIIRYIDSSGAQCVLESKPDGIYLTKEASPEAWASDSHPGVPTRLLVSQQAATKNLYAEFTGVSYENGIVKIEGLKVCKKLQDSSESKQVLSDLGDVTFEIEVIGRKG